MKSEGWSVIDEDARVLYQEYEFSGRARATTLVFRGEDGLVVVSPGRAMPPRELDALAELGEVRALVANNAYHHLGQGEWRRRFPNAVSYAPGASIPRLGKQAKGIPFQPLETLALPGHVRCEVPAGMKAGETLLRIGTAKGPVWYMGDLVANMQSLPPPPMRWLFTLTDSAPGLKLFKLAVWMLVSDRRATKDFALSRLAEDAPKVLVPAHGPAFDASDLAERLRAQLERL